MYRPFYYLFFYVLFVLLLIIISKCRGDLAFYLRQFHIFCLSVVASLRSMPRWQRQMQVNYGICSVNTYGM
jgi:hypothetical protein